MRGFGQTTGPTAAVDRVDALTPRRPSFGDQLAGAAAIILIILAEHADEVALLMADGDQDVDCACRAASSEMAGASSRGVAQKARTKPE